jgi:TPP-dependent pyruvate/acetoin dehydrogenase alpha subunit
MASTIKPSSPPPPTPPPAPSSISPKALELTKDNRDLLLGMHREMQLIRRFEERAQEQYTKAKIGGYCHLNIGEEATVVGGILALKPNDWIFTSYREHGHAIARGVDPKTVMAELFGKETGRHTAAADRCTWSTTASASWAATGSWAATCRWRSAARGR